MRGTDTGRVMANTNNAYPNEASKNGVWYTYIGET